MICVVKYGAYFLLRLNSLPIHACTHTQTNANTLTHTHTENSISTHSLVNGHFGCSNKMYISMQGNAFIYL